MVQSSGERRRREQTLRSIAEESADTDTVLAAEECLTDGDSSRIMLRVVSLSR
jgi:hypothetical protein